MNKSNKYFDICADVGWNPRVEFMMSVHWSLESQQYALWIIPDTVIQCGCLHHGSSSAELNGYCQL